MMTAGRVDASRRVAGFWPGTGVIRVLYSVGAPGYHPGSLSRNARAGTEVE